jgi:hypothetical protein
MAVQKLDKAQWRPFFERVTKYLAGKPAEIEIASLALGDQIAAKWLPLLGIVYEAKTETLEIALDGLAHSIRKPQELYVDLGANVLVSMEVIDAQGTRQIIRLREPLTLPPPAAAGERRAEGASGRR